VFLSEPLEYKSKKVLIEARIDCCQVAAPVVEYKIPFKQANNLDRY
jgi:hypothetical protein